MIGNPIDYDKKYISDSLLWSKPTLDNDIKKYLKLLNGRNILGLGIGEGQNSIALSELGYNVTGIDYSKKALDICRRKCSNIELIEGDIRNFKICANKYDLILSTCVLHFLHKSDVYAIIENIKNNIKQNGLVYISVFSIDEPGLKFKYNNPDFDTLENNIFHKNLSLWIIFFWHIFVKMNEVVFENKFLFCENYKKILKKSQKIIKNRLFFENYRNF